MKEKIDRNWYLPEKAGQTIFNPLIRFLHFKMKSKVQLIHLGLLILLIIPCFSLSQQLKMTWLNITDTIAINRARDMEFTDDGDLIVVDLHSAITDIDPGPEDTIFFPVPRIIL